MLNSAQRSAQEVVKVESPITPRRMMRVTVKRGFDLSLGDPPAETIQIVPPQIAVLGADYPGVRPHLAVEIGDRIERGQLLFADRAHPQIRSVAPVAGRVRQIHRGARRRLDAIVIETDAAGIGPAVLERRLPEDAPADSVRTALQQAGLWSAFRTRPFDRIPLPDSVVREIYVTAIDSNPLAPDPAVTIRPRTEQFTEGLRRLARLAERCYLCSAAGAGLSCPDLPGLMPVEFSGPHPAGLPGTHIHHIARAEGRAPLGEGVWHIGYQDVLAVGELFLSGRLDSARVITVAGPAARPARRVRTTIGAALSSLIGNPDPDTRIVSGSIWSGTVAGPTTGYLGRRHNQVLLLPADDSPQPAARTGMLALEDFERVWPFDVPPLPLLRALLIEDTESASALGATLFAAEDLALCAHVCPAELDYGAALDRTLEQIRRGR